MKNWCVPKLELYWEIKKYKQKKRSLWFYLPPFLATPYLLTLCPENLRISSPKIRKMNIFLFHPVSTLRYRFKTKQSSFIFGHTSTQLFIHLSYVVCSIVSNLPMYIMLYWTNCREHRYSSFNKCCMNVDDIKQQLD